MSEAAELADILLPTPEEVDRICADFARACESIGVGLERATATIYSDAGEPYGPAPEARQRWWEERMRESGWNELPKNS